MRYREIVETTIQPKPPMTTAQRNREAERRRKVQDRQRAEQRRHADAMADLQAKLRETA